MWLMITFCEPAPQISSSCYSKVHKERPLSFGSAACQFFFQCTPDRHWFAWNVHGKFQNPVISLDDSNLRLMVTLELSNGIAWFWNIPCTFHANQCPSSVHLKTCPKVTDESVIRTHRPLLVSLDSDMLYWVLFVLRAYNAGWEEQERITARGWRTTHLAAKMKYDI